MTSAMSATADRSIFDPRTYAEGIPYGTFARLRTEEPVSWQEEPAVLGWPAGPGFWAVTRYDDVREVSRTPEVFSAWRGCTQLRDPDPEDLDFIRQMMLNMDPPVHNRLRKLVSKAFTPGRIARFSDLIRRESSLLIDRVCEKGSCDFAVEVSDELPLITLSEMLGMPRSDRHLMTTWVNRVIGYQDEEFGEGPAGAGDTADRPARKPVNPRSPAALKDMFAYASQLAADKRKNPADDLITALVHAEVDGRLLTEAEFEMFFFLLTIAGTDTTRSAIPHGVLTFAEHPAERQRVLSDPARIDGAVEEVLRYCPPVIHFRRTATRDVALRGARIREGDKVVVFYPAANRDPEVFPDPDRFDVSREPDHLSFGFGPHICLGAGFARLQIREMFAEVLNRLPDMEVAGPVERLQSNFIAGIKHLPVRFTPTKGAAP